MKTAFSRIFLILKHLWHTVVRMLCKRKIRISDTNSDGVPDIIIESVVDSPLEDSSQVKDYSQEKEE